MTHLYRGWIKEAAFRLATADIPRKRLDEVGWTDFQSDPPPATAHLHEFVALAVELCCFDDDGIWVRLPKLLLALVQATEQVTSTEVPVQEIANLVELLEKGIGETDRIRFWFQVQFAPSTPP